MPYEIVLNKNRDGVSSLRFMSVYNFTRIETKHGELVGFYHMDEFSAEPQFFHPWQVMHARLTSFENIYHPYGRSIIDGGRKAFKQLRLMEDAALIYRITRAPEKRKFLIPVGLIPPKEVPEYMQMIARNFKRQRFYNPTTGAFDERYSPLIQEDDFFLPRRPDGAGPDVETMPGAENLDQIADIEYFKKKMIAPTKIPFSRVGIGDGSGEASEKSLSQSHSEFAKAVQWVQREIASGLTKVAIVHLALRGYSVEDLKGFEIALTATSAMEELYRIETWQTRASVMGDLKDLGWFPKEWIVTHFTDLSPDEIEEMDEMESIEKSGGEGAVPGGGLGPIGGGGGIDDLGEGLDEGGDLETPEADVDIASMLDADAEAGGDVDAGLEGELEAEGYDLEADKRMIAELARNEKVAKKRQILESWAKKRGKSYSTDDKEFGSGFSHLVESKELDGLTSESVGDNVGGYDDIDLTDNSNPNILVESSVEEEDRKAAIGEVYNLLKKSANDDVRTPGTSTITEDDIPK
tara:strand:+ start:45 stop:1610 length:1566 start_codon:yes stop_codon:yes gene_type:complete